MRCPKLIIIAMGVVTFGIATGMAAERTLEVVGLSEIEAAPDQAVILLTTRALNDVALAAADSVNRVFADLDRVLTDYGVAPEDIEYRQPVVEREIEWTSDGMRYFGFSAYREARITVRDLGAIDGMLHRALDAGLTDLDGVVIDTSKRDQLQLRAVELACLDARRRAAGTAAELGVTLGKPVAIREVDDSCGYSDWSSRGLTEVVDGDAVADKLGRVSITSRIMVSYALVDD